MIGLRANSHGIKIAEMCNGHVTIYFITEQSETISMMADKNEYLKEILPSTGLLFQQEFQSFILSKPKLIPLKSVTLQKLETMQQEAEKKAKEQMSKT
ncbi:hypothetical protein CDAR_402231 [Caerostris darwini]|uniref:Uncharacterized protein n=1 Tax=Caerostris darwini TaxID=1538125 RepID=A0AAV4T3I9_9ARAC|nr:hypothetical protein CDAR_402231 [Caerostris darwini]